jgi:hypothetical protein
MKTLGGKVIAVIAVWDLAKAFNSWTDRLIKWQETLLKNFDNRVVNWIKVIKWFNHLVDSFRAALNTMWEGIKGWFGNVLKSVTGFVSEFIVKFKADPWGTIKEYTAKFIKWCVEQLLLIPNALKNGFTAGLNWIKVLANDVKQGIADVRAEAEGTATPEQRTRLNRANGVTTTASKTQSLVDAAQKNSRGIKAIEELTKSVIDLSKYKTVDMGYTDSSKASVKSVVHKTHKTATATHEAVKKLQKDLKPINTLGLGSSDPKYPEVAVAATNVVVKDLTKGLLELNYATHECNVLSAEIARRVTGDKSIPSFHTAELASYKANVQKYYEKIAISKVPMSELRIGDILLNRRRNGTGHAAAKVDAEHVLNSASGKRGSYLRDIADMYRTAQYVMRPKGAKGVNGEGFTDAKIEKWEQLMIEMKDKLEYSKNYLYEIAIAEKDKIKLTKEYNAMVKENASVLKITNIKDKWSQTGDFADMKEQEWEWAQEKIDDAKAAVLAAKQRKQEQLQGVYNQIQAGMGVVGSFKEGNIAGGIQGIASMLPPNIGVPLSIGTGLIDMFFPNLFGKKKKQEQITVQPVQRVHVENFKDAEEMKLSSTKIYMRRMQAAGIDSNFMRLAAKGA